MRSPHDFLDSLFSLQGLNAVVLGGSGVLGGAIAETLAQAGADTYIVGRDRKRGEERVAVIQKENGHAEFLTADITSTADLQSLADDLANRNRECHILVNAAGVNSATPFLEIEDDEWEKIFNVNLNGIRKACQIFGNRMLQKNMAGSIINVASLSGITPLSKVFTYSASKAAVINLSQNLAREWAPHGIRVNSLSPGFFPAEQNRKILTEERTTEIMSHTPMNRFGEPHELAGAVLLLASTNAGSFITGTNLVIDGGFMCRTI